MNFDLIIITLNHNRGASVMAIFICILKNQLGMEGDTGNAPKACYEPKASMPSLFLRRCSMAEKLDNRFIADEFRDLQCVTEALRALRESFREYGCFDEPAADAWNGIVDLVLERQVATLNYVLVSLCGSFEGLEYKPVATENCGGSFTTQTIWGHVERMMKELEN